MIDKRAVRDREKFLRRAWDSLIKEFNSEDCRVFERSDPLGDAGKPYDDLQLSELRRYMVERGGDGLRVYEVTRLLATIEDDRKQRDAQTRAAYYKGRDYGKRMERDKREKILEGYIDRARYWKERAKTAEGQLRGAGAQHAERPGAGYLSPYQQLLRLASGTGYGLMPSQFNTIVDLLKTRVAAKWGYPCSFTSCERWQRPFDTHRQLIAHLFGAHGVRSYEPSASDEPPPAPEEAPSRDRRGQEIVGPTISRSEMGVIETVLQAAARGYVPVHLNPDGLREIADKWTAMRAPGQPYFEIGDLPPLPFFTPDDLKILKQISESTYWGPTWPTHRAKEQLHEKLERWNEVLLGG